MTSDRQVIKAMAAIRRPRDGAVLVSEHVSPAGAVFHRPLGGHVEFGEHAEATVRREFAEEIGQDLGDVRLLGVLENIFSWGETLQHEVVFLFSASFLDPSGYEIVSQPIADRGEDGPVVIWRAAGAAAPPLYPDGSAGLITADLARPGRA